MIPQLPRSCVLAEDSLCCWPSCSVPMVIWYSLCPSLPHPDPSIPKFTKQTLSTGGRWAVNRAIQAPQPNAGEAYIVLDKCAQTPVSFGLGCGSQAAFPVIQADFSPCLAFFPKVSAWDSSPGNALGRKGATSHFQCQCCDLCDFISLPQLGSGEVFVSIGEGLS